jgi:DNA repair protein RadD
MLRPYQQRALDMLYAWFRENQTGNPCLSLPTGSGKSHVIAALVKDAVQTYPDTRILMLTHAKELITQNLEKLRHHWDDAPVGVYSASLRARELHKPITFAAIQSVRNRAHEIGHIDLCIVDEAHAINHAQTGGYRKLIAALTEINPALRVVGLTASPYRLGHGMIHEGKDVLFDDIIEPVSIIELVESNYLAPLRSKHTDLTFSTAGIQKSGGEYVAADIERHVDTEENNRQVIKETIERAKDRRSILVFCATVKHAHNVAELFAENGVHASVVTGATPLDDRDRIISHFKQGQIRILVNVNVLTTGFDHTGIDCVVFLRPTMSPGLYYQMAGRGLRIDPAKKDCLVLDFAGNVGTHGPITAINPPPNKGEAASEVNTKVCPSCDEILPRTSQYCTSCGHEFISEKKPLAPAKPLMLHDDDIMGVEGKKMVVTSWMWSEHIGKKSGKKMLKCQYYGKLSDPPVTEYFPILSGGFGGQKAIWRLTEIAEKCPVSFVPLTKNDFRTVAMDLNNCFRPSIIYYKNKGGYSEIIFHKFT